MCKLDYEISKTVNKITKIPKTLKKVVSDLQKASFLLFQKFLNFWST